LQRRVLLAGFAPPQWGLVDFTITFALPEVHEVHTDTARVRFAGAREAV
jgi:hypothetical protein